MKATILRNVAIFTSLVGGIYACITGNLPGGDALPQMLSGLDVTAWQWAKYPIATALLIGLLVAWIIYIIVSWISVWGFQRKLMRLALLRPPGTKIRQQGMAIAHPGEVDSWGQHADAWAIEVYDAMKRISAPDAERFDHLGYPGKMRPHQIHFLSDEHKRMFVNHDCREQLLDKFYDEYSKKQWS